MRLSGSEPVPDVGARGAGPQVVPEGRRGNGVPRPLYSPRVSERFDELRRRLGEIHDLEKAAGLLSWDEETKMPPTGADARAEQRATLNRIAHDLQVAPELGELLEELASAEEEYGHDSFEASLVRVARRDYDKAVRVPSDLRAELTRAGSFGYRAWLQAREQEDYSIMLPHLEHNLELRRQYVACFEPEGDPYDVLLDDYEPGMTTAEVEAIFDQLKAALVPLIRAIDDSAPVDDSCLRGHFPRDAQRRFSLAILERWGMDRASWRLDRTVHPFATSMSPTGHPADDELPRGQPARDPLVPARVRPRHLRAPGRPALHAHAARARRLGGVPRVAEPHVGEPRRPQPLDLEVLLSRRCSRSSPTTSRTCRSRTSTGP